VSTDFPFPYWITSLKKKYTHCLKPMITF
jgi:hypothetical protein